MISAYISEIYASVQGEGPFTGERQIFVRLAGCPLRCRYCDTPDSLTVKGHDHWTVEEALSEIGRLARQGLTRTVSVTGGEPLVQPLFLRELFKNLKKAGFRTYLETAGVHHAALKLLVKSVDTISMDMKLPSATGKIFWKEHEKFLQMGGKKVFVKVVIDDKSTMPEIKNVVEVLSRRSSPPILILQPATPRPHQVKAPSLDQIADAYEFAKSQLPDVRVMPQQHKIWKVR